MSFERRDIKDIFKSSLNKCMHYLGTEKQKEIKISSNFCEILQKKLRFDPKIHSKSRN